MAAIINWGSEAERALVGGCASALSINEPEQLKNSGGKVWTIVCVASGTITLLDGTSGSGETLLPQVTMTSGQVLPLFGFPFFDGLYASAVTGLFNISLT